MYHYTESGLLNVWLVNGYQEHETPYGRGLSIEEADELHRAICREKGAGSEIRLMFEKSPAGWRLAA